MPPYVPDTLPGAPAAEGAPASAEAIPMTEDTSEATLQPVAEQEPVPAPMPGVTPLAEEAPSAPAESVEQPPDVAAVPTTGGGTTDHAEWANQALAQLETGQQAMARGDFVGYGQAMSELRSFLLNIAQTSGPAVAGVAGVAGMAAGAGEAASAPSVAPAYDQTAPPAPAPVEPAAEAGELAAAAAVAEPMAGAGAPALDQSIQPGAGAGPARLVVISSGAELPLPQQEEITVGREDPSSGIFPDIDLTPYGGEDGGVSRRHARLLHMNNDYFVEDLQSTNYTKVDGQRLPARVREKLEDGARLDFGRVAVIFRKS